MTITLESMRPSGEALPPRAIKSMVQYILGAQPKFHELTYDRYAEVDPRDPTNLQAHAWYEFGVTAKKRGPNGEYVPLTRAEMISAVAESSRQATEYMRDELGVDTLVAPLMFKQELIPEARQALSPFFVDLEPSQPDS